MSSTYRFDLRDPSLTEALRRIAGAETAAILRLTDPSAPPLADGIPADEFAIHGIRKRSKKLRALLRLMRAGMPKRQPAENAVLRGLAQSLAHRRDAAVRQATFDAIAGAEDTPASRALRAHLVAETTLPPPRPDADAALDSAPDMARLHAAFQSLALRIEGWQVQGQDRRVLAEGLAETRLRARAAMRAARDRRSDEALHDWRKRAKDVWYQTRLLHPVWPDLMRSLTAEADQLGKALGRHHDLADLARHFDTLPEDVLRPDLRAHLAARLTEAQTGIEAAAFPLGARLFAGDPEQVADLWVKWWKLWRAQIS